MNRIGVAELSCIKSANFCENIQEFVSSSRNIRKNILSSRDPNKCIELLVQDFSTFNQLIGYVGYRMLCTKDPGWIRCNDLLERYLTEYYSDEKFFTKLSAIIEIYAKNEKDLLKFVQNIYAKKINSKKLLDLETNIKMYENRIFNLLNCYPTLNIASKYINNSTDQKNPITVELTEDNYVNLLNQIDKIDIRHLVEKNYLSRTKKCLVDMARLVLARHQYARLNNCQTYFQYINRGKFDNTETIKDLITSLNEKINKRFEAEIDKIHSFYCQENEKNILITNADVLKYVKNQDTNVIFLVESCLQGLFNLCGEYFGLAFIAEKNKTVYNCYDKNRKILLGRLHCDLDWNEDKNIKGVIAIKVSDRIKFGESEQIPEAILLGAFHKTINYKDCVALFREMGHILQYLCYDSRVGLVNYDEEFTNLIPIVMEYIAWDKNTIMSILSISKNKINHEVVLDHLEHVHTLDQMYCLKLRCIGAKFDHLLHNSVPFLDLLTTAKDNEAEMQKIILELYQKTHKELMEPIRSMFRVIPDDIDPIIIAQQVNNSQGLLYSNLMNEMFAYGIYWIITHKKDRTFRESVLTPSAASFRDLVREYLKKADINSYNLFVRDVIRSNPIEDYATEDINYFDDQSSDDNDDVEQVIQIKKVVKKY